MKQLFASFMRFMCSLQPLAVIRCALGKRVKSSPADGKTIPRFFARPCTIRGLEGLSFSKILGCEAICASAPREHDLDGCCKNSMSLQYSISQSKEPRDVASKENKTEVSLVPS